MPITYSKEVGLIGMLKVDFNGILWLISKEKRY
jgi:hypothetical protein